MLPLDLLLQRRVRIKVKKNFLCANKNLNLKQLRFLIRNEIALNHKILFTAERIAKSDPLIQDISRSILQHNQLLEKQLEAIVKLFQEKTSQQPLQALLEKENSLSTALFKKLKRHNADLYAILASTKRKELLHVRDILDSVRKNAYLLKSSFGNRAKVTKYGNLIVKNIERIEESDVYDFMKGDLEKIKERVRRVIKDPKEASFLDLVGTFYFFLPGSFEMTSAILFLRYSRHY